MTLKRKKKTQSDKVVAAGDEARLSRTYRRRAGMVSRALARDERGACPSEAVPAGARRAFLRKCASAGPAALANSFLRDSPLEPPRNSQGGDSPFGEP